MLRTGVILMALLSTTLFGNWFTDLFDSTPTPTIKIPIDLTKAGVIVDKEFRVNYKESTRFFLRFSCKDIKLDKGKDCKELRKFIGLNGYLGGDGKKITIANYRRAKRNFGNMIDKNYDLDGTKVPLKFTLNKIEENGTQTSVIDKTYNTKGDNGGDIYRFITVKYLVKGKYRLKVENLKAFPELQGRAVEFRIQSTYRK